VRRADRVAAVILLALAVAYSATAARQHTYWSATGPAAGFLPFWLGVALAILAVILLVGAVRQPDPGPAWAPRGHGAVRFVVVILATAAFIVIMPIVGMTLATALFLTILLRALEGRSWLTTLGVAVGMAAANWAVFVWWLGIPFPAGVFGF
jgi:putative tricarboxylic transport membrane protein